MAPPLNCVPRGHIVALLDEAANPQAEEVERGDAYHAADDHANALGVEHVRDESVELRRVLYPSEG